MGLREECGERDVHKNVMAKPFIGFNVTLKLQ